MELLLLTPCLVLSISLVQRRLGDRAGGRLTALPLTSIAVIAVVVTEQGTSAAQDVAQGIVTGTPIGVTVLVGCAWLARKAPAREVVSRNADLIVRVVVTTGCVAGISVVAQVLPPTVAGLAAAFRTVACVLAVLTRRRAGGQAARELMFGVLMGMPASAAFLATLAGTLGHLPTPLAFGAAAGAGLAGQYLRDRVDAVVKVRLGDHQWRGDAEGRVVGFLAQHAARHQFFACLAGGAAAGGDLDACPQAATPDLRDAMADQCAEALVQVGAKGNGPGQEVAVAQ